MAEAKFITLDATNIYEFINDGEPLDVLETELANILEQMSETDGPQEVILNLKINNDLPPEDEESEEEENEEEKK